VNLTLNSSPGGLALVLNGSQAATPFTRTVIQGSRHSISAPTPQTTWQFKAWSDGGAQTHDVTANSSTSYTATYEEPSSAGGDHSTTPTPLLPLVPPLLPPQSDAGGVPVTSAPRRLRFSAYVTGVIDGDTIKVRHGVRLYTVRLIGIDTPETRKPGTSVECGGREATSRMFRLGFTSPRDRNGDGLYDGKGGKGLRVRVMTDPTQRRRDRYGRLLAYVASARGGFARAQLRAGWASVYVSEKPFERLATFQAAEASAREDSRGIWAQCRPARKRPSA
jgi:micrococcal nuclease